MTKIIPILLIGCLVGCGSGGGDDTVTDSRTCITNINNVPDINIEAATEEGEEAGFEVVEDVSQVPLTGIRNVAICGTAAEVDAVISNPQGRDNLSLFLATGQ